MRGLRVVALLVVLGAVAPPAHAVTVQRFTTSQSPFDPGVRNQGWWSAEIANNDSNDNYIVDPPEERNFFTFDLTSACRPVAATLRLTRFDQPFPLTYLLWDVSTPAEALNANEGTSRAIFDDLGSGTSFGTFPVEPGAPTDVLAFRLNAAGVAAVDAARGGRFSVGGSAITPQGGWLFGFSDGFATQELVLTCAPVRKDECKGGGWRDFGVFTNQGDCVSYVATGGRNGPGGA